ncbi:tetratricopeptide repeat protein [Niallia sp. HCP3S3_B10]|uniref:tetratricopeptide repeat protein n=1 Tax=unclassified Niallia TaxID=2837522 RepID=UPI00203BF275|nr:tetratricopeptide repeat protein [Niallia sp. MER TA 168]MCM3362017.1 tetratricopeptide repeat protein [Niallia sp. MER TA 168]
MKKRLIFILFLLIILNIGFKYGVAKESSKKSSVTIEQKIGRLENVVKSNKSVEIYNELGELYLNDKDYSKAITTYKEVLELEPGNTLAYNNLSNAYIYLKEYNKAIDYREKILLIEPENLTTLYYLSQIYLVIDLNKAEVYIKKLNSALSHTKNKEDSDVTFLNDYSKKYNDFIKDLHLKKISESDNNFINNYITFEEIRNEIKNNYFE